MKKGEEAIVDRAHPNPQFMDASRSKSASGRRSSWPKRASRVSPARHLMKAFALCFRSSLSHPLDWAVANSAKRNPSPIDSVFPQGRFFDGLAPEKFHVTKS